MFIYAMDSGGNCCQSCSSNAKKSLHCNKSRDKSWFERGVAAVVAKGAEHHTYTYYVLVRSGCIGKAKCVSDFREITRITPQLHKIIHLPQTVLNSQHVGCCEAVWSNTLHVVKLFYKPLLPPDQSDAFDKHARTFENFSPGKPATASISIGTSGAAGRSEGVFLHRSQSELFPELPMASSPLCVPPCSSPLRNLPPASGSAR